MVMATESIAILALTLCIIFLLIRGKHVDYAASVSPILLVPGVHLLSLLLLRSANYPVGNMPYQVVVALADMVALALSCALFAAFSTKIKRVRTKRLYIIMMLGYSVALTCAYVYQTLEPLGAAYLKNL